MSKREYDLDLVIQLLEAEKDKLTEEIKNAHGSNRKKIELKGQIKDAIKNLKFFETHKLFADDIEILKIPEGGSDSYYTEFYIVDECELKEIDKNSIKRDEKGNEITLSCFDLILKT